MSLPSRGGLILIQRGLIAECQSAAELGLVIGHEIGHLFYRHIEQEPGFWSSLGMGLLELTADELRRKYGENSVRGGIGSSLAQVARQAIPYKYSRNQEV
jgi:predicted Zn-dependent protease